MQFVKYVHFSHLDMYTIHIHLFLMHTLYASNVLKVSSNFTLFWNIFKIIIELIHKPLAYLNNSFLNKFWIQ
jgi:hypothetical protein